MARRRPRRPAPPRSGPAPDLRIVGGRLRGSKLAYSGDPRTRPMKERVREAAFNLIGPLPADTLALDLFAGTGALALEAISRGATEAVLVERHFPTAKLIEKNIAALDIAAPCRVVTGDTFHWVRHELQTLPGGRPWLTFCSPPYQLYQEQRDEMLELLRAVLEASPPESQVVAEFDRHFDAALLPRPEDWDVRTYAPAVLGIWPR